MVQDLLGFQPPLTEWLQTAQRRQPLMVPEAPNVQLCRRTAAERLDRFSLDTSFYYLFYYLFSRFLFSRFAAALS